MRVVIAGGRDFTDYELLQVKLNILLSKTQDVEIVSGGAKGADTLAERYAKEHSYPFKLFKADWKRYGKSAGYRRNNEMADYCTHVVVFWDGQSKGTKSMLSLAIKRNLPYRHINY